MRDMVQGGVVRSDERKRTEFSMEFRFSSDQTISDRESVNEVKVDVLIIYFDYICQIRSHDNRRLCFAGSLGTLARPFALAGSDPSERKRSTLTFSYTRRYLRSWFILSEPSLND
jgi:hypothetical protein